MNENVCNGLMGLLFGWLNKVRPTTTERVFDTDGFMFSEDVPFQFMLFKIILFIYLDANDYSAKLGVHGPRLSCFCGPLVGQNMQCYAVTV